jgi:hypothetical protein
MAITTADGWFGAAKQKFQIAKTAAVTSIAATPYSLWGTAGNPGAGTMAVGNTTAGVLFTDATAGANLITNFAGVGYLAAAQFRNSVTGGLQLYDRIWGAGAVSMTALATTTFTGNPVITGRLPGGNDYGDTEILIEFTTTVSATATTIAVGYTNEAGTTGRTTGASASTSGFVTPRILRMPLQAGDKGVQSINSVTVGGTVATAGAFNVLLVRRLAEFDVRVVNGLDSQGWDQLGAPIVFQDSCLFAVAQADSTSTGTPTLAMTLING